VSWRREGSSASDWFWNLTIAAAAFTVVGELVLYIFEWLPLAMAVSVTGTYCVLVMIPYAPDTRAERIYTFIGGALMAGLGGVFIGIWYYAPAGEMPLFLTAAAVMLAIRGLAFMIQSFMPEW